MDASKVRVKITRLSNEVRVPEAATDGAACFDIRAFIDQPVFVGIGNPQTIGTGLAFAIPEDYVMLVFSRSGHGFKNSLRLGNCVGVIDSDFRGELMVSLTQDPRAHEPLYRVSNGDRIAQALVIPRPAVEFELVDELPSTVRGTGGGGSTGVK